MINKKEYINSSELIVIGKMQVSISHCRIIRFSILVLTFLFSYSGIYCHSAISLTNTSYLIALVYINDLSNLSDLQLWCRLSWFGEHMQSTFPLLELNLVTVVGLEMGSLNFELKTFQEIAYPWNIIHIHVHNCLVMMVLISTAMLP